MILPTKPRTPRHKGKIENGINYVQENALKGKLFNELAAQNTHLQHWETHIADTRIHGTTRQQVRKLFEIEKTSLQPLPLEPFPCCEEGYRARKTSYEHFMQLLHAVEMDIFPSLYKFSKSVNGVAANDIVKLFPSHFFKYLFRASGEKVNRIVKINNIIKGPF